MYMLARNNVLGVMTVFLLFALPCSVAKVDPIILDPFCSSNLTLPTIDLSCIKGAQARDGKLKFTSYPSSSCSWTLTLDGKMCEDDREYAINLDFAQFEFEDGDFVNFYEDSFLLRSSRERPKIVDIWKLSIWSITSRFSHKPAFEVRFYIQAASTGRNQNTSATDHERNLILEYKVVREDFYDINRVHRIQVLGSVGAACVAVLLAIIIGLYFYAHRKITAAFSPDAILAIVAGQRESSFTAMGTQLELLPSLTVVEYQNGRNSHLPMEMEILIHAVPPDVDLFTLKQAEPTDPLPLPQS